MAYDYISHVHYDDIDHGFCLSLRGAMRQMQEAAAMDSSRCGYGLKDIPRTHVLWVVGEWRVRLLKDCPWGERISVCTWPRTMERAIGTRSFEILDDSDEAVAVGDSKWIMVSTDNGRATMITPEITSHYDLDPRAVFSDTVSMVAPEEKTFVFEYTPMRRDIDTNGHVNNLVYYDLAMQAVPEEAYKQGFSEIAVRFFREVKAGNPVRLFHAEKDGKHFVDILNAEGNVRHALVILS